MPNCSAAAICGRASRPVGSARRTTTGSPKHVPGSAFPAGTPRRSGTSWRRSPRSPARHHARSPTNTSTPPASRCPSPTPAAGKNVAAVFHRLRLTLFHAGRLSTLRRPVSHPPVAVTGWATVAPGFAESAHRYVEQVTVSLRASTVKAIEHDLREFGTWLADTHPEVGSCADLHREHIEAFKTWLCTHPTPRTGAPLNRVSIKNALINLHCFFTRITEWG